MTDADTRRAVAALPVLGWIAVVGLSLDVVVRVVGAGAEGLLAAAVASAVIAPTLLGWIGDETRGIVWRPNDLALGVAAVGLAMGGLAHVYREAVRVKLENDEFV